MSVGQTSLDLFGVAADESDPQVYVACPLTYLSKDQEARRLVEAEIHQIRSAIERVTSDADPPWRVRVHAPMLWTAPWNQGDNHTPETLYVKNRRLIVGDTDALVVHGFRGGSTGVGQEFFWAQECGIPILFLHHDDESASRQVIGAPALLTVATFREPAELDTRVAEFLRNNRSAIESGPIRRRNRAIRFEATQTYLERAWKGLQPQRRAEVAAAMGQSLAYINSVVEDPLETGIAPSCVLTSLMAHLGVGFSVLGRGPELATLDAGQLRALFTAADEHEWTDSVVQRLIEDAQSELARPSVRRFRLDTPDDWLRFRRAL